MVTSLRQDSLDSAKSSIIHNAIPNMKLNLNKNIPAPLTPAEKIKAKFYGPVQVWRVTTEGDCEGRTTRDLGEFYGHIAEIAFSLADKVYYSLHFSPVERVFPRVNRPYYDATKKSVWIRLDIKSGTWDMDSDERARWIADWMDVKDEVKTVGALPGCQYYASVHISLI